MGFPKALLPLGNDIFLTRILDTLAKAGLPTSIVVLGKHAPHIEPRIAGRPVRILINDDPGRGQLSSIQLAIQDLAADYSACLVWPVDLPLIPVQVIEGLAGLFLGSGALIAYPSCREKRGHPVIFHRSLFWGLLHCPVETGARSVVMKYQNDTVVLPTDDVSTITDIDTPEDYFNMTGRILDADRSQEA